MSSEPEEKKQTRQRRANWGEQGKQDNPLVSFRINKQVKEEVEKAAKRHGRNQSAQMAQCVEDGLLLQSLISKVSLCLEQTNEEHISDMFGSIIPRQPKEFRPSEQECLGFIAEAVSNAIAIRRNEWDSKHPKNEG